MHFNTFFYKVLFGCNVIEMIPPKLDDCKQSPHFIDPWTDRLAAMSEWCDLLDVKVRSFNKFTLQLKASIIFFYSQINYGPIYFESD